MGIAVVILLIVIPVGVYMILRPRKIWWATQAWKFRDPEANEPSDASYAFSRLGGVMMIVGGAVVALLVATGPLGQGPESTPREPRATANFPMITTTTTPPPPAAARPEDRGAIPIVGYQVHDGVLEVRYRGPRDVPARAAAMGTDSGWGCKVVGVLDGEGAGRVTVGLRLTWFDPQGYYGAEKAEQCRVTDTWAQAISVVRVAEISSGVSVLTDGPIIGRDGDAVTAGVPGRAVPELTGSPR